MQPLRKRRPQLNDIERENKLTALGEAIAERRAEAIAARKASGIEEVWLNCEETYLGIDELNRGEFVNAKWAKPTSMSGPLTKETYGAPQLRSTAFVRLTSRYVDAASSKLCEVLLPINDKAFAIESTPVPDLVKGKDDLRKIIDGSGNPVMRHQKPDEVPPPQQPGGAPQPMAQPGQQAPAQVPMTVKDAAEIAQEKAQGAAEKAEKRIYDWMVECKFPAEMRKVVHDAARLGAGLLKGPIPDIKTSKALTKGPGKTAVLQIVEQVAPAVRWCDIWNFFPDDACGENIQNGDYVFERDFLARRKLSELKKQKGYLAKKIEQVLREGPEKCDSEGKNPAERAEKKEKNRFTVWYFYGMLSRDELEAAGAIGLQDLPEEKEDIYAIVTMVNDTVIRATINPMESGKFPFHVMSWSRRAGSWAGVGVAEQCKMPQATVNAATRALLNNAGQTAGPQIVIDQAGIVPSDGNYVLTPGKIWYKTEDSTSDDVRKIFAAITFPNIGKELMSIIEYGMKLAEESTNIPLVTQGQTGDTTPDTFGGMELQNENAHTWIRDIAYRFDDEITEPVVDMFYEWLLLDESVPDEEKGDFRINAHGSIAMVERAIQEKVLLAMMQMTGNPAFKIDPKKLFAEVAKSKRMDPRKIQYSEEEQAKMDAQPPQPPIQIQVEQTKGQNALAQINAKAQAELQVAQQEAAHEQQLMQTGGMQPHQAQAMARIEQERIRAQTAQTVEASRAAAEEARAQKEYEIAQQNGQFKIQEMELQRDLELLKYANQNKMQLNQVKADLAKQAIDTQTKRELAAAEIQLSTTQSAEDRRHEAIQGDANRALELTKHATQLHHDATQANNSLVRDEMSTKNTP